MKKKLQSIIILTLLLCVTSVSFSQKAKVARANEAYDEYSYIDAREIYLKVVEDGYKSAQVYERLGDTYYYNSDYENAAIWYQKLINEFPEETEPEYYLRAAQSLKSLGNYKESDALMQKYAEIGPDKIVIQNFEDDPNYLESIAFSSRGFSLEKVSVNTEHSDFGPAFYGDNKLVFASAALDTKGEKIHEWNEEPFLDLFVADRDSLGRLSNPQPLSGDINTKYHESSTVFTHDGKHVYFTRNNFYDGKKGRDENRTIRLKLFRATKNSEGNWTDIIELPFNSDEYSVAHPALNADESRLYFSSDMPGTEGMSDIWFVPVTRDTINNNETYGTPVNLEKVNTEARESFPFISANNNLYFSSDGRAGLGGYDLYVTKLNEEGRATQINNLGEPANSRQDDFGFIIDENKRLGYLSSNREGTRGSIDDEIYRVQESCLITLTGTVFDEETNELLPGAEVTLMDENNAVLKTLTVGGDAAFSFDVDCEKQYSIRGIKQQYAPNEKLVFTPGQTGTIEVPLPLRLIDPCPPNDLGCRLNLQPIYFDFDRYNIRPDAEVELAKILSAMRQYPELIIHIESHTDSRGNDAYNKALSEKRAQSTLNWLVDHGIERKRLSAKGYGETQLVNQCSNGVNCTEEEHQLNRRSMFIIQN